ncbi:MAG: hypothetical protein Q9208_008447 [Pyrenodesmia sp. 3 TL-2023]
MVVRPLAFWRMRKKQPAGMLSPEQSIHRYWGTNQQLPPPKQKAASPAMPGMLWISQELYHVLHSGNAGSRKPPPINRSTKPTQPDAAKSNPPARSKPRPTTAVTGGDVRLTQCPRCKRFADKYVEHDFVVLFIDLVLVKPQVSIPLPDGMTR